MAGREVPLRARYRHVETIHSARIMNNRLVSHAITLARLRSHFLLDIIDTPRD